MLNKKIEPEINTPKGFYYDIQTKDPTTRISLHPNTSITGYTTDVFDKDNTSSRVYQTGESDIIPIWEDFSEAYELRLVSSKRFGKDKKTPEVIKKFHPEPSSDTLKMSRGVWADPKVGKSEKLVSYPYAREAICSAILNEDFKVSITNTFSKLGGDPLGEVINNMKSGLPLMEHIGEFLKSISKKTGETSEQWKKEGKETTRIDTLGKYLNIASKWEGMNTAIMNRAIVFQGARFSYYGGTGVSFDNVSLNYTIFPYWDTEDLDESGFPKFKTVYDQLEVILPYVIGDFVPLVFAEVVKDGTESKAVTFLKDMEATVKGVASSFGSWQLPPAGFEAAVKDIDVVQKGTLKLKIGSLYSIENIVISSCNFSLSKHLIKHPQKEAHLESINDDASQYLTPAFCDVQLGLKPISMASKNSLLRFIRGEGTVSDKEEVYKRHENTLNELEERLKSEFSGYENLSITERQLEELRTNDNLLNSTLSTNAAVEQYDNSQKVKQRQYVPISSNLEGLGDNFSF